MRRAGKRDANEPAIVKALRAAGYGVKYMPIGAGFDLVVWSDWAPANPHMPNPGVWLLEVKDPAKRNQLTPEEQKLQDQGCPIHIVCTPEEALRVCGG